MASRGVLVLARAAGWRRCLGKEERRAAVMRGRCWASMMKEESRVLGEDDTTRHASPCAGGRQLVGVE